MAILGEMCELGKASAEEHEKIVSMLPSTGCEEVWLVGKEFKPFAGKNPYFDTVEDVEKALKEKKMKGRLILIKGSNATHLYQLPEFL